jgi:type II secretory pathway pseudopilin PulG
MAAIAVMAILVAAVLPFVSNYRHWAQQESYNRSARLIYDAIQRYNSLTTGPKISGPSVQNGPFNTADALKGALEGYGPYAISVSESTINTLNAAKTPDGKDWDRFMLADSSVTILPENKATGL